MGGFERKIKRNKLKKMMGNNKIGNAWQKYQEIQKVKARKKEDN